MGENFIWGMRSTRNLHSPATFVTITENSHAGVITLDQVRPQPRTQNEYVDTPGKHLLPPVHAKAGVGGVHSGGGGIQRDSTRAVSLPTRTSNLSSNPQQFFPPLLTPIVSSQPVSTSPPLKKDLPLEVDDSIICSRCGKCRCGACTESRELPSRWLCGDKVNLSPESAIEHCTCFCCVQCLFYHYSKDDQDNDYDCYTDPCACCNRPHCCKRWTCILLMSLCLPCLCVYWPAKCGLYACTACYNKCRRKGCTCNTNSSKEKTSSSSQSHRLLLVESESSSNS
ncbi:hypothetical protein ACJMK2_032446 [Sinanodonta woodiana]|uniref:Protein sprouty homolog 2 n=1 Tax=Sinanodonta woodiana TaxID=1069815 RepID=A0ABD3X5T0_SINWO